MGTRKQIVDAANRLFYQQGYERTSFASIAEAVGISRGNFYYHFKTKDEILEAVLQARLGDTRAMLAGWTEAAATPLERVFRFVDIVVTNRGDIELYGCPVGTLTSELAKLGHPSRAQAVGIFGVFRDWLGEQFKELGHSANADDLALQVLAFSQGVATLSNAFGDRDYVERDVRRLKTRLMSLDT
ncbi:TetR/AcrR family transcriptional regulator [Duganella violaceipulchra]|uniref:AcrR family transcriptional regulator n=1 Tax=Duganella violaceipulchra TaxID=2849652 RepID=A0AA41L481_9BURK|nr:TetR/AcrR family transcriptional regulator [Duganella violaceicalia]MBV6320667.1 TetR/AcrR family transcriptional regulator [Duganella violaceicalia]MCP2008622.1 AcrR family transcriptional regulator [Duganella violaceicalia]